MKLIALPSPFLFPAIFCLNKKGERERERVEKTVDGRYRAKIEYRYVMSEPLIPRFAAFPVPFQFPVEATFCRLIW